jgi:hypothetical protein
LQNLLRHLDAEYQTATGLVGLAELLISGADADEEKEAEGQEKETSTQKSEGKEGARKEGAAKESGGEENV